MEFSHVPVLYDEVIENLAIRPDGIYVDGTLGGGGHSRGICARLGENGTLIGIDRDEAALAAAAENLKEFKCRKIFVHDNYSNVERVINGYDIKKINGAVLDLGVSSFQLDASERGFSYMQSAPLDMRMDQRASFSAYDVVNTYSKDELTRIIKTYGEERWAARISDFIVKARKDGYIETTGELVDIIKAAIPAKARREGPHPAKRTFQAIRIEVNNELDGLGMAVDSFVDVLAKEGRLCIITFHSLEDRIVKEKFAKRANPCTCPKNLPCVCGLVPEIRKVSGKPIVPTEEEVERNPRARSAKLRVAEKL
jgi:16S rRNA (cytosine1402-N4)-methyltransferase